MDLDEKHIAALLGAGGATATEFLLWQKERDERRKSEIASLRAELDRLKAPTDAGQGPGGGSTAALSKPFHHAASQMPGVHRSDNIVLLPAAGAQAFVGLNNFSTNFEHTPSFFRLWLNTAGLGLAAGPVVSVSFPEELPLGFLPSISLRPANIANPGLNIHTATPSGGSRTGFIIEFAAMPGAAAIYMWDVVIEARPA